MTLFIELCNAKPEWLQLSTKERENYLDSVGEVMKQLERNGTQIISWGVNSPDVPNRLDYDYFAVFLFPTAKAAQDYETLFSKFGWYNYFSQVNVLGESEKFEEVLNQLINL